MFILSRDAAGAWVVQSGRRVAVFVARQPGWVTKGAIVAAGTVMLLVLMVLIVPALLVAVLFVLVGSCLAWGRQRLDALRGGSGGRRNVRVLPRAEE
jgi:hypothetical protein